MSVHNKFLEFLVDTGSSHTILPQQVFSHPAESFPKFTACNDSPVHCYGVQRLSFKLGTISDEHDFSIAEVSFPILGYDFLAKHNIDVSLSKRALLSDGSFVTAFIDSSVSAWSVSPRNHCLLANLSSTFRSNYCVYVYFGRSHPFSQFHPCKFQDEQGVEFSSAEQYMMYHKALLFNDSILAREIMSATNPAEIKKLARFVIHFNTRVWTQNREKVAERGNFLKFSQSEQLEKILLSSGDKTLAEANVFDCVWGIGLGVKNSRALDPKNWRGSNLMGKCLMRVRKQLRRARDSPNSPRESLIVGALAQNSQRVSSERNSASNSHNPPMESPIVTPWTDSPQRENTDANTDNSSMFFLRSEFPSVFEPRSLSTAAHDVVHSIELLAQPRQLRPYRIPFTYHAAVKKKFDEMLSQGIIRPSSSPYLSPLVCVPKKDGSIRPCVDFRAVNKVTVPDRYTLPRIDEIIKQVKGRIFSTIDLRDGFHQIPVAPHDIEKTAVATPWGSFEYTRMPFGLRNAPPTFQRFMNLVVHGLSNVSVYIDDVIVFSNDEASHIEHLSSLFRRFDQYGIVINDLKSKFCQDAVNYLGFEISHEGYRPRSSNIPKLDSFSTLTSKKDVQKFLGLINFYRGHIPHCASLTAPLATLATAKKKFRWTTEHDDCFQRLKTSLSERMVLATVDHTQPFELFTDASSVALGAALMQNGKAVEFFSKKLSPVEQRYSTYDREALAITAAIKHFKPFILGVTFQVFTDHKPLTYWLTRPPASERHARWLVQIQECSFSINHLPGTQNALADHLSRPVDTHLSPFPTNASINVIELSSGRLEIAAAQTDELIESLQSPSLSLEKKDGLWYETSTGNNRLVVPLQFRHSITKTMHEIGHFGQKRLQRLIGKQYFWPCMRRDVTSFVRSCKECQISKPTPIPKRLPTAFANTDRLRVVHIDIVGPLPPSGKRHVFLLTMIDRATSWLEAIPVSSTTAEACAGLFLKHWVSRFGVPDTVVSDQGPQFESTLFNTVLQRLGCLRRHTTAYHPQTNGKVERAHRTLKDILRCLSTTYQDWEQALPIALLSMRAAIGENGFSPSQLLYGESLALPGDLVSPSVAFNAGDTSDFYKTLKSQMAVMRQFLSTAPHRLVENFEEPNVVIPPNVRSDYPAKHVWILEPVRRHSLAPRYLGPFPVLSYSHPVVTVDRDGQPYKINVDRTKPAWLVTPIPPVELEFEPEIFPDTLPPTQNRMPPVHPPLASRFGRLIRPPDRYLNYEQAPRPSRIPFYERQSSSST